MVTGRLYQFHSRWNIQAPKGKVWHALAATPFSWQQWWPELTSLQTLHTEPAGIGTRFSCTWRARSGYKLRANFTIIGIEFLEQTTFASRGDLVGSATWTYSSLDRSSTEIIIDWQASTTKRWMNWFAPILKPLFVQNHDAIMASGERGLNNYLRTDR